MIWKAVGFRDMLAIASVICALCARETPSPYVAQAIYHAPTGAYHEREAFYITRRKALYHVALSDRVRQTTLSTWVKTPKGIFLGEKRGWKLQKVYFIPPFNVILY